MTFLEFVTDILQPAILPTYRKDYRGGGGERWVHGCVHVSRCVIFSEMMRQWYIRELGVDDARFDALAVRLALGWHDAGREGDGKDIWEGDSARLAEAHARRLGLPEARAAYIGSLIVHQERRPDDPNAHLVQACDTLDVLRCFPGRTFEPARFRFLAAGDPCVTQPPADAEALRRALIREAEAWIDSTEAWQLKQELDGSPRCCEKLLANLRRSADKYPTMSRMVRLIDVEYAPPEGR